MNGWLLSLTVLAQRGYFKEKEFINYLSYLQYWKKQEYAKYLKWATPSMFGDDLSSFVCQTHFCNSSWMGLAYKTPLASFPGSQTPHFQAASITCSTSNAWEVWKGHGNKIKFPPLPIFQISTVPPFLGPVAVRSISPWASQCPVYQVHRGATAITLAPLHKEEDTIPAAD